MSKVSKRNTILSVLVTVLFIAVVYLVVQRQIPEEDASIGDLDDDATDIVDVEQLPPESDTISIPGYPSEIQLADGQSMTHIELKNPEDNTVYFKFSISIGELNGDTCEDSEILYESDLVKPGQMIATQELARPLSSGTYDASIIIQTFSMLTEEEMNGARTFTQFIVN